MRTLSATLLAAQRVEGTFPLLKITFSKTGETDVVVEQDRILSASGIDAPRSQKTDFVFQNASRYFNDLDLKGWSAVVQRGMTTTAGAEYDSMPPMKVLDMGNYSGPGTLPCLMTLIGIPDLLAQDKASKKYLNHWSNTKTPKDLITEILDGNAVDIALTEQQLTTDDFVTMPITIGTSDTAGAVKTTAAVNSTTLAIKNLGTGEITRGTTLTIAGDDTTYTVKNTVAITANEATVTLTDGLAAQATLDAVVTLAVESGTRTVTGVALTISNRTVTTVTFKLKKVGLPTGNVTFKVSQDDGGSNLASKTVATSTITTSAALVTATLTTPLLVNERVWLTAEYGGGDASNYVCVAVNTTVVKVNEAFVSEALPDATVSAGSRWEDASQNCVYQYTYTAGTGTTNGVDCFEHCTAYVVVYDSEDSLIDTYVPAGGFQIREGTSRLDAVDTLLGFTKCVGIWKADGKFHVFVPTTTGTTYDYQYVFNVAATHQMLAKSVRDALVVPNKITAHSYEDDDDQYTGSATDATSYALLPIEAFIRGTFTSNALATSVAEAAIARLQMASQRGSARFPINLGAELYDYVKVTDSRANDSRTGNPGYYRWSYVPGRAYVMFFSFGAFSQRPIGGPHTPPQYQPTRQVKWKESESGVAEAAEVQDELLNTDLPDINSKLDELLHAEETSNPITVASIAAQVAAILVDGGYLKNIVEDLSPQLGADLDLNGKNIDFPSVANISDCLDEDTMASDSATKLATQQSIKAYVGNQTSGKLSNVVEDTTPQLGGTLDVNSQNISGIKTTLSNVTSSRNLDTQYTNSTGYPLLVYVEVTQSGTGFIHIMIGGTSYLYYGHTISDPDMTVFQFDHSAVFLVPVGYTYKVITTSAGSPVKGAWVETTIGA